MQRATDLPAGLEDLRGKTFKDRYEITDLIDAGTRRALFAGREREGQRPILLRVIRPLALHEEATVTRFGKRIAAVGRVRHPAIQGSLDSGEVVDGSFWASYERPAGRPLLEALADAGGRLAWPDARGVLLELVQGLRAAHASRVVHGALHPSSCWIDRPAQGAAFALRLIDLGTNVDPSLEEASLESSRTINLGNDAVFIAPETVGVSMGDQRSDLYLVGLLAYALLTGRPPFEGSNAFKVMTMHMQAAPPPMRDLGADVPPAVEALVRALLAKEPHERPDGMARIEQLVLGLDEDGQPQEVPVDESARSGGRRGRGRAKRGQGADAPARENSRGEAIARATAPSPSSSGSSLQRMLPGQEIMSPATPVAPRSAHGASAGAAAVTDRPTVPPRPVVVEPTPAPMPIAMPTPAPSDPLLVDGGTLMLPGSAHAPLDAPLTADGGTLMLSGNAHALLDAPLPADGGTLLLSGNSRALLDAPLPADGGTLLLSGNAHALLDAPLPADGGTLLLSGNASAPLDGTLMLSGGDSSDPLEGTLLLSGPDEPKASSSKPASSAMASTMLTPGSARAEAPRQGSTVARNDARSTAVTPRRAGTDTARASSSTQGTTQATKPSASSTLRRESLTLRASRGRNSEVWFMALTVLAVVAGVAVGWLL